MSINEEEKRIKFPEEHYVGFQPRKDSVNLGFMTPYGNDSAAKNRIRTVDNWAKGNMRSYDHKTKTYTERDPIPSVILKNGPIKGFKLSNSVNHSYGWNTCRDKWRIEDPRGFELEITSGNLEKILEYTDIIKGEIQEECIWARLGADNLLVPVSTDMYKNIKENTDRYNNKASTRDLKPGYRVILQNGEEGIYMGLFYIVSLISSYNTSDGVSSSELTQSSKKRHVFRKEGTNVFFGYATPKLSSIQKLDLVDNPEKVVNDALQNKGSAIRTHSEYSAIGVTSLKNSKFSVKFEHNKQKIYAESNNHSYGFFDWSDNIYAKFSINQYRHSRNNEVRVTLVYKTDEMFFANIIEDRYYGSRNIWGGRNLHKTCTTTIPDYPSSFSVAIHQFSTSYGVAQYKL